MREHNTEPSERLIRVGFGFVSQEQLVRANERAWLNCRQSFDTLKKTPWRCSTSFIGQSNSCRNLGLAPLFLSWLHCLGLLASRTSCFTFESFILSKAFSHGTIWAPSPGKNFQGVESPACNTYWLWSASIPSFLWVCLPFSFHNPAFLVAWGVPRSATAVIRGKGRTERSFCNCSPYFLGVARSWSDFLTEIVRKGSWQRTYLSQSSFTASP